MLFQEKKTAYCYFAGSVLLFGPARDTRAGCTNSYNFRPCESILSAPRSLSPPPFSSPPTHPFILALLPPRCTGDHVSHVDDRLRGARTRACFARGRCTRACTHETREHAVVADATDPMHFNIGSFNDLHNEAVCFLSSRVRPRRLSRATELESICIRRDGIRDINRPHNACNTLAAQLHPGSGALFLHMAIILKLGR